MHVYDVSCWPNESRRTASVAIGKDDQSFDCPPSEQLVAELFSTDLDQNEMPFVFQSSAMRSAHSRY